MGNVVQRLTHRGGEFRLTPSNEGSSKTPKITVSSEDSSNNQDEDLEPNGGEDGLTYNSNFTSQCRRIFFFHDLHNYTFDRIALQTTIDNILGNVLDFILLNSHLDQISILIRWIYTE